MPATRYLSFQRSRTNKGKRLTHLRQWLLRADSKQIPISIYHEGPSQAYLSKAPADLESYTGDGDWFKIGMLVTNDPTGYEWATMHQSLVSQEPNLRMVAVLRFATVEFHDPEDYAARQISYAG
jgi:hypothetical protein